MSKRMFVILAIMGLVNIGGYAMAGCHSNNDCADTEFCASQNVGCNRISSGECIPVSAFEAESVDITIDDVTTRWTRSTSSKNETYGKLYWTSIGNWCNRQKRIDGSPMEPATRADLGCGDMDNSYCTETGFKGLGRPGTALRALQEAGWDEYDHHWLEEKADSCFAYSVDFYHGIIGAGGRLSPNPMALCK